MGADFIVHQPCEPKLAFGHGDALEGTKAMMAMVKARNRAQMLLKLSEGQDPSTLKITVVRVTPQGQVEQEVSYRDLMAEAEPLEAHAKSCQGCPANFLATPYGCYGALPYPVTAAAENWLVNRLQPADSPGGFLLMSAISDFNYDGAPVGAMRSAGIFELKRPAAKVVQKKFLSSTRVNGDRIFQAFLAVGGALSSGHCAMLLSFVGALAVDGRIPTSQADAQPLSSIMGTKTADERRARATLELGPETPEIQAIQALLRGAYTAWVLDVELLMDA